MLGFSKRLSWQLLASMLVVILLTIAAPDARAASTDSTAHGVRLASPAVVRILTTIDGQVIYHAPDGSKITFPSDQYTYRWVFSGSGALISPDGYVLTADHVVDFQPNDPYIQGLFLQSLIQDYAKAKGISEDQASQFFKQFQNRFSYPYKVTRQQVFLTTAYTGLLQSVDQVRSYPVADIMAYSPVEKRDVAIIKIEANGLDLPYLTLALASNINVQDSVTAIAFPVDAETSSFVALVDPTQSTPNALNDLLTPSIETGQVTAEKPLSDGSLVYETSNIVSSGSSGGPVVNSQGQIIGFVDFMSSNQRVAFLVPSEIITQYIKLVGIANQQAGAFMSLWTKAINEHDASGACHWTQAYQDLKQLSQRYPQFGGVQLFLKEAQAKATPSECPPPPPPPNWLTNNWPLLAGLGVGVILVGTGLLFFAFWYRKKAMPQAAATMTSTSAGAMPAGVPLQDSSADQSEQAGGIASGIQLSPTPPEPAPAIRKCISGHVVTVETAHFCPECGAPIEEPRESKVLLR